MDHEQKIFDMCFSFGRYLSEGSTKQTKGDSVETKEGKSALELSIEHHERNRKIAEDHLGEEWDRHDAQLGEVGGESIDIQAEACALCKQYCSVRGCGDCPVAKKTGEDGCHKTPWYEIVLALRHSTVTQGLIDAETKMIVFLKSLRQETKIEKPAIDACDGCVHFMSHKSLKDSGCYNAECDAYYHSSLLHQPSCEHRVAALTERDRAVLAAVDEAQQRSSTTWQCWIAKLESDNWKDGPKLLRTLDALRK